MNGVPVYGVMVVPPGVIVLVANAGVPDAGDPSAGVATTGDEMEQSHDSVSPL